MIPILAFAVLGLAVTVGLVPLLRKQFLEQLWGQRGHQFHQTHHHPISRLGGVALAVAFIAVAGAMLIYAPPAPERFITKLTAILGALAMFGLGFWDDLRPLGAKKKLLGQIVIAALVYAFGVRIEVLSNPLGGAWQLAQLSPLVTIFWLVAFTNLINLVDGMDGLASGISLMLMIVLVVVGYQTGSVALLAAGVAGSLVGFLIFNFPPAKIYLGDGGAYFLGFLIGELSILSSHKGTVFTALVAPLFVLALPILDVSLAIIRRGLKGLPVFRADKGHIHHRLLEMGLSRRRAVVGMYAFTLFFLLLALVALRARVQMIPVLAGAGMIFVLLVMARLSFTRHWFSLNRILGHSLRMRQEVEFALSVTRWVGLEGTRVNSTEELWNVFRFAAERLGFSAVQLELVDGVRHWRRPDAEENFNGYRCARFDFRKHGAGLIELRARPLTKAEQEHNARLPAEERQRSLRLEDEKTFNLIGELLAESWHKANLQNVEYPHRVLRFAPAPAIALSAPASA